MLVSNITVDTRNGSVELNADLTSDNAHFEPQKIWFRYPPAYQNQIKPSADPFLAATLLPAMIWGEPLRISAPISPQLLKGQAVIQAIFSKWLAQAQLIAVEATPAAVKKTAGTGVGCFFSGGVDSFYSYLQHQSEISHLILLRGFDRGMKSEKIFEKTKESLEKLTTMSNQQLLIIETNCRSLFDRAVSWDMYHGSVLAAVGLSLADFFQKIYIPSTYSYAQLYPWGSHPLLDPHWSIEGLEFIHDGCGTGRLEKIKSISSSDLALKMLRVCWRQQNDDYNCGRCEKCLRTMIGLHLAGKLLKCSTFNQHLTPNALKSIKINNFGQLQYAQENLKALTAADDELSRKLSKILKKQVRGFKLQIISKIIRGKPLY